MYKKNVVFFVDLGFANAPFSVKSNFLNTIDKIKFRSSNKEIMGFGLSYKWFSIRLRHTLSTSIKEEDLYGKSKFVNLGVDFSVKRFYWDIDLRTLQGYALKDAYMWDSKLNETHPNLIDPMMKYGSFSVNTWYFNNSDFKMQAVLGRTGHYLRKVHTWYIKSTFNIYGLRNNGEPIIPNSLSNPNISKTESSSFSATDGGIIPGYAYVNRKNNWQISGFLGLGAVIQAKKYKFNNDTRGFLGLAPRYDVRFVGGYSVPKYFIFLITEFDNKSISFTDLTYHQNFYSFKIAGGIRLLKNEKKVHL